MGKESWLAGYTKALRDFSEIPPEMIHTIAQEQWEATQREMGEDTRLWNQNRIEHRES
jgi:hypothetical protein